MLQTADLFKVILTGFVVVVVFTKSDSYQLLMINFFRDLFL